MEKINQNSNIIWNTGNRYFEAPISGFYEFQFIASAPDDDETCMKIMTIQNGQWATASSSCNAGGVITLSAITNLPKGALVCVLLEKGYLFASSNNYMQFSGKYIGPS